MANKKIPQPIKKDLSNKSLVLVLLVLLVVCLLSLGVYLTVGTNTAPLTIGGAVIFGSENVPLNPEIENQNNHTPTVIKSLITN